jgi:uncharacterized protein YdhG (YjbR/CyaY superfamily)
MAQASITTVDEYLAAQPAAAQRVLRRVRTLLRKALPTAEELLSYKIPAYRLPGGGALFAERPAAAAAKQRATPAGKPRSARGRSAKR